MNSLKAPLEVGTVSDATLRIIRNVLESEFTPLDNTIDGGEDWLHGNANDSTLLNALKPITDIVLQNSPRTPYGIRYTVMTGEVATGQSQIGSGWHVDGGKNYGSFLVADTLPTEFLIRTAGLRGLAHIAQQRRYQHIVHKRFWGENIVDESTLGMTIFTPPTHAVMHMKDHIHRSACNTGLSSVSRTFVRASILPSAKATS